MLFRSDPAPYWTAIAEVVVPRIPEAAYGAPPPDLSGVGPICPLLDGATVGGILDVEIGRVEGDDVGCTYTTPDATIMSDGFVTVNGRYDRGGLALIRSAFPDGETLQVDGRDAWWSSSIKPVKQRWASRDSP